MKHSIHKRVGFHETDQMRYLYHGNYAALYHTSRTELLRTIGLEDSALEKRGVIMPVVKLSCSFIKPAYYDDELEIVSKLVEVSACKLIFHHQLFRDGELINEGETAMAYVDIETRKPIKIPEETRGLLEGVLEKE